MISTPSCLRSYNPSDFALKVIATAGEPCPQSLADKWTASGTTFYNCCGPTEVKISHCSSLSSPLTLTLVSDNHSKYDLQAHLRRRRTFDRSADSEQQYLHPRRGNEPCSHWGCRHDLGRWPRCRKGICQLARKDGGIVSTRCILQQWVSVFLSP